MNIYIDWNLLDFVLSCELVTGDLLQLFLLDPWIKRRSNNHMLLPRSIHKCFARFNRKPCDSPQKHFQSRLTACVYVYGSLNLPGMIRNRIWMPELRSLISCVLLLCGNAYKWRQPHIPLCTHNVERYHAVAHLLNRIYQFLIKFIKAQIPFY